MLLFRGIRLSSKVELFAAFDHEHPDLVPAISPESVILISPWQSPLQVDWWKWSAGTDCFLLQKQKGQHWLPPFVVDSGFRCC